MMASSDRGPSVLPFVLVTLVVVLSIGGGLAGYVLGSRGGENLARARAEGRESGERAAARLVDRGERGRALRAGRRAGYKSGYRVAYRKARLAELSSAPTHCGDVPTADTPSLAKVRAEAIACPEALAFVRSALECQDLDQSCHGWSCEAVSTGYESSEITCTSGPRRIRFETGV